MNASNTNRSHYCGELSKENINHNVTVMGWVFSKRVIGKKLAFIDLKDREGIIQLVFTKDKIDINLVDKITNQSVIWVTGIVVERKTANPELKTGEIEIKVEKFGVFSVSEELPFALHGYIDIDEEVRYKFRYLDLRRDSIFEKAIKLRHNCQLAIFKSMDKMGFYHVDTPILLKSTPEGARDYIVPSRLHNGKIYALPQSPQILKQLSMISGIDKYFQIAKCFRDEDLRSDRQPEFTQIDIEMSFVEQEQVFTIAERLMKELFKEVLDIDLKVPFPRVTYSDTKSKYGSDKPEFRIKNKFQTISSDLGKLTKIKLNEGETYKQLVTKKITKKVIYNLINESGINKGIVQVLANNHGKKVNSENSFEIITKTDDQGYLTEEHETLRRFIANEEEELTPDFRFTWITDFPLFDFSDSEEKITPNHHPFTSPHSDDIDLLDSDPLKVRANAYDLVLNGYEIGGGSIRIHDSVLQRRIFDLIGLEKEEAESRFGFLLEAFKFGAPPHGGIAFGFDRLLMIMAGEKSIKEVITFPKTRIATDLLTGAPDKVNKEQLEELGIKLIEK